MKQKTSSRTPTGGTVFRVRLGTSQDLDILVHQRRAMWEEMGIRSKDALDRADAAYRQWAHRQFRAGKLFAWLAETNAGKVVGGGCLWLQPVQPTPMFNGKAQPYLMSMYTEARHRNKGVASLIVRKMLDWSKKNGYLWVVLHASREGRRVYKALGFRRLWEMGFDFTRTQPVDSTS